MSRTARSRVSSPSRSSSKPGRKRSQTPSRVTRSNVKEEFLIKKKDENWGGYDGDFGPPWFQLIMIIGSPVFVYLLFMFMPVANKNWPMEFSCREITKLLPEWKNEAVLIVAGWVVFQAVLYFVIPGSTVYGPVTPAGNKQKFKINAVACWFINVVVFVYLWHVQKWNVAWISSNLGSVFNVCFIFGVLTSVLAYLKAIFLPTNTDVSVRPSMIENFFLGMELSPRLPYFTSECFQLLDSKLFVVGHCGMMSWTIVNLCHAVAQYEKFGSVSLNMILVNVMLGVYTIDWAVKEEWYLFTIDMRHDRFGYYFCFGCFAWMPVTYCMQAWYLSFYSAEDITLSFAEATFIFVLFWIFWSYVSGLSNNQKDEFRAAPTDPIWGKGPRYIVANYRTSDGSQHKSLLLASGYWGISRHFNYFSDLIMCLCFSLPCRFGSFLPYFYFVYMFLLLVHRSIRDDRKCRAKYGAAWDQYCKTVPFVIVPYIY